MAFNREHADRLERIARIYMKAAARLREIPDGKCIHEVNDILLTAMAELPAVETERKN